MPLSHDIDVAARRVVNIARGVITAEDLLETQRLIAMDPRFDQRFDQLLVFRDAVLRDVSPAAVEQLAIGSPFGSTSRRAVVVSELLAFGLVRTFQEHAAEMRGEIQLFTDLAAAEAWLDRRAAPGHR